MSEVIISGLEGRIEARYHHSENPRPNVALVLHAHPLHGGNMNSSVTYNMYHSFVKRGFSVLRINFRGVGKSQGTFEDGIGELTDAATALDWLQSHNPVSDSLCITGFSFGSWIAMQILMRRPEISNFITVSLPINKYDFSFLSPCPTSGLILHGEQDSIVPVETLIKFSDGIHKQKGIDIDCKLIPKADHFFREKLDKLNESILEYVDSKINKEKEVKVKIDRRRRNLRRMRT
ncbi:MAG: alpha/beta hydrolase [Rickettsiales bacterium]|nr:alpha/beta hydrolase [Rickettsiales bacterium]